MDTEKGKKQSETNDVSCDEAQYWIKNLELIQHPEGGYFKETYRSDQLYEFNGKLRQTITSIYFCLDQKQPISHFHEVDTTEYSIFSHGDPVEVIQILDNGEIQIEVLGPELHKGQKLVVKMEPSRFFAFRTLGKYTLFSCVCAPGFVYEGFRMIPYSELIDKYPKHKDIIEIFAQKSD